MSYLSSMSFARFIFSCFHFLIYIYNPIDVQKMYQNIGHGKSERLYQILEFHLRNVLYWMLFSSGIQYLYFPRARICQEDLGGNQNVINVIAITIKYIFIYRFKQAVFKICGFMQFKRLFFNNQDIYFWIKII